MGGNDDRSASWPIRCVIASDGDKPGTRVEFDTVAPVTLHRVRRYENVEPVAGHGALNPDRIEGSEQLGSLLSERVAVEAMIEVVTTKPVAEHDSEAIASLGCLDLGKRGPGRRIGRGCSAAGSGKRPKTGKSASTSSARQRAPLTGEPFVQPNRPRSTRPRSTSLPSASTTRSPALTTGSSDVAAPRWRTGGR